MIVMKDACTKRKSKKKKKSTRNARFQVKKRVINYAREMSVFKSERVHACNRYKMLGSCYFTAHVNSTCRPVS